MLQQFNNALSSYISAYQLIQKHKLWNMFLLSSVAYLVIVCIGLYGVWEAAISTINWILDIKKVNEWSDKYKAIEWMVKILSFSIYVAVILAYLSLFKYILLTVASPLYAYISEKTASVLTGKTYEFNARQLINDMIRGIRLSIRNLLKQSFLTILLILFSFIPLVGLVSGLLIIILDSYYYGFAMIDYNSERKKMSIKESLHFIRQNRGLAIGNGFVFYLFFLIPVIGIMFGAPLSAIAATISLYKEGKL